MELKQITRDNKTDLQLTIKYRIKYLVNGAIDYFDSKSGASTAVNEDLSPEL